MMESDDDDEEIDEEDEEAVYERLITEVLQESKLAEMQKNFDLDLKSREEVKTQDFISAPSTNGTEVPKNTFQEKTYTPSKSGSWGVFDRPADISKAYGGGRTISREVILAFYEVMFFYVQF